ncbi:MAG: 2OG-Fe(II) oxygenase [Methylophilaceae bacterium]|nr:2OG-Fe(II) oxygenase [Methylophilaceae bacterium]
MLLQPEHHQQPFPFFFVQTAFSEAQCAALLQLFLQNHAWQHQDGVFYRCSLCDVTAAIPATFQAEILNRMREITGLPLVDRMLVTVQRMLPGHAIGIHSDRPLLGYEIARLVVQLNKQWQPEHGGVLQLFSSPQGEAVVSVNPEYNQAVGFLLHADSYHAVTEVSQQRQSVVFNFWHMANTPELAAHVEALFANLHFSEFPAALNPIASAAESSLSEELTYRAGTAAIALHRWGYDAATIVTGYQHSAGLSSCNTSDAETYAAVLLADWVANLYRDSFDLIRWNHLQNALAGMAMFPRLMPTWQLCLPEWKSLLRS